MFLIYITGMLVLFGYMLAISPNNYYSIFGVVKKVVLFTLLLVLFIAVFSNGVRLFPVSHSSSFERNVVKIYSRINLIVY